MIPPEVREILSDSLTERGMEQWWNARLRILHGNRPVDWWPVYSNYVIGAAHAFAEGYYV